MTGEHCRFFGWMQFEASHPVPNQNLWKDHCETAMNSSKEDTRCPSTKQFVRQCILQDKLFGLLLFLPVEYLANVTILHVEVFS